MIRENLIEFLEVMISAVYFVAGMIRENLIEFLVVMILVTYFAAGYLDALPK